MPVSFTGPSQIFWLGFYSVGLACPTSTLASRLVLEPLSSAEPCHTQCMLCSAIIAVYLFARCVYQLLM